MAARVDVKPSSPWVPKGITRSNSTASAGGRSTESYESIKVIGRHPFDTLRLISHDDPPLPPPPPPPPIAVSRKRMSHNLGRGDVLIVLSLPEDYVVGHDAESCTTDKFVGMRQLPAGPHFFWAAHPDNLSCRSGFWIMSTGIDRVHVVQWHMYNDVFVQPTRTKTRTQAEEVHEIYGQLPPYRDYSVAGMGPGQFNTLRAASNAYMWEKLTWSITRSALNRIAAEQEEGWNMHTCDRVRGACRSPSDMELTTTHLHPIFQCHDLKFCFQEQSMTFSIAYLGPERPLDARDSTSYILSKLKDDSDSDSDNKTLCEEDVVGEFQFLYVASMYLGNSACIRQWWFTVLNVIFRAYRLAIRRPSLMAAFLSSITAQVTHSVRWVQTSIFEQSPAKSRDMRLALIVYKRRLNELLKEQDKKTITPDHLAVKDAFARLETVVISDLGWSLRYNFLRRPKLTPMDDGCLELEIGSLRLEEDDSGEWTSSVVQLDDHGRELRLISWRN
ncbi:Uncharacterized protein TCAP_01521 [Tolypocladium capitatum]|uniref:Uncharacterized protein n=1 Tax=Tolypocladium capitatum TaxID=45235 RepID=A0A2K3QM09_9HYPO|nr:Uncharacterized protein TCAP_01521 [Tolypocladium capitatum]